MLNPSFFFRREITNYGSEFSRLAAPNNLNRFYFCVNVSHVQLHVTFYCLDVLYTESVNRNEIDSERIQFFLHYLSFTNILHPFEDRIKTQHLSTIGSVTDVFEATFNTFQNRHLATTSTTLINRPASNIADTISDQGLHDILQSGTNYLARHARWHRFAIMIHYLNNPHLRADMVTTIFTL